MPHIEGHSDTATTDIPAESVLARRNEVARKIKELKEWLQGESAIANRDSYGDRQFPEPVQFSLGQLSVLEAVLEADNRLLADRVDTSALTGELTVETIVAGNPEPQA